MWNKSLANRNNGLFPGHDSSGTYTGNWGLEKEQVKNATASDMFQRASTFLGGGSGYKREALRNSFGLLSKQQKQLKGFGGFVTSAQNALIAFNVAGDAI